MPLTAIHINFEEHRIELEDSHGTVTSLSFPPLGTISYHPGSSSPSEGPDDAPPGEPERERTVTLSGRLTTKPRQGRQDRSGNPTAYARFAAHDPERQGSHDYVATFHRHTVKIALDLPKDAQITVEGYPHQSGSEKRMDTFSVINIVNWPGKAKS